MRLPFLRRAFSEDEYRALTRDALERVVPVPALMREQGVALGAEAEQGRAHLLELAAVRAQLEALRPLERALGRVRAPRGLGAAGRSLGALLKAYRGALGEYARACEAVRDADVEAYRAHNRLGRELDARACEAVARLAEQGLELPEALGRIAGRAEAYRNVQGGGFAFWE